MLYKLIQKNFGVCGVEVTQKVTQSQIVIFIRPNFVQVLPAPKATVVQICLKLV